MTDAAITELAPALGVRAACDAVGAAQASYYRRHRHQWSDALDLGHTLRPQGEDPPAPVPRVGVHCDEVAGEQRACHLGHGPLVGGDPVRDTDVVQPRLDHHRDQRCIVRRRDVPDRLPPQSRAPPAHLAIAGRPRAGQMSRIQSWSRTETVTPGRR